MSQKTDAELLTQAGIIKNETEDGANTAARIGAMYDNIIDSKLNNESVGPLIAAATSKTTPVDGDSTIISDSEASGAQKKLTWANLKATLKTYFDSLYQAALGYTAENTSNKSNSYTLSSTTTYPNTKALVDGLAAERTYAEGLVVGLWDDRGNYDPVSGNYPSSGGSGTAGAIMKGDIWTYSTSGTQPIGITVEGGDTVRALIDSPGNTQLNWAIAQNNIGYIPENASNKTGTIAGNEASTTLYSNIKGIVDWVNGLTIISKDVTSNAMLTTSANTIKIDTTASGSFDNTFANKLPDNIQGAIQKLGGEMNTYLLSPVNSIGVYTLPDAVNTEVFTPIVYKRDTIQTAIGLDGQWNIAILLIDYIFASTTQIQIINIGVSVPYEYWIVYKKLI